MACAVQVITRFVEYGDPAAVSALAALVGVREITAGVFPPLPTASHGTAGERDVVKLSRCEIGRAHV